MSLDKTRPKLVSYQMPSGRICGWGHLLSAACCTPQFPKTWEFLECILRERNFHPMKKVIFFVERNLEQFRCCSDDQRRDLLSGNLHKKSVKETAPTKIHCQFISEAYVHQEIVIDAWALNQCPWPYCDFKGTRLLEKDFVFICFTLLYPELLPI